MKWLQNGNLAKLVAFFVIAVTICCTVSFAANGWQSFTQNKPDSDNSVTQTPNSGNVDENTDGNDKGNDDITVSVPDPKYYHYITGLEIPLEDTLKRPLCMVYSSSAPLYGISSSFLTIELPTEYGQTRLLAFTDSVDTLGKIGSLAPTRGYISTFASYFGGVLLSYGNDDTNEYSYLEPAASLDFKETSGYCYTEYNSYIYTNRDLVTAYMSNSKISAVTSEIKQIPYSFNESGVKVTSSGSSALTLDIIYSSDNTTELTYSEADGKYQYSKNGTAKKDLLNDKTSLYDNVFVLYADSTTYETEESTRLVLDTSTSGKGVYLNSGKMIDITWSRDSSGNLTFYNEVGEKLAVEIGSSYIAVVKASSKSSVKIS